MSYVNKPRKKAITMLLFDEGASGRVKCTMANWTGIVYKLPRNLLSEARDISYLSQTGIYCLFGSDEDTGRPTVYVGQAGIRKNDKGVLGRIEEHKNDRLADKWQEAIAFGTTNDSFGQTEISYLENRFYNIVKEADRYILLNQNEPSIGNVTEEKEAELEEYIYYAKIIVGTLGHKMFVPYSDGLSKSSSGNDQESHYFYLTRNGADAKAVRTEEGFVLLKGSRILKTTLPSCSKGVKRQRDEAANKLFQLDENFVTQKDILFNTPSGAACFVVGGPANGRIEWKTAEGKTLKAIESEE